MTRTEDGRTDIQTEEEKDILVVGYPHLETESYSTSNSFKKYLFYESFLRSFKLQVDKEGWSLHPVVENDATPCFIFLLNCPCQKHFIED